MRKLLACSLLALALGLVATPLAQAAVGDLVIDEAGILTDGERETLNNEAERISARHHCEVAIIVVEDKGAMGAYDAAELAFTLYGIGYGPDRDGVLLFLSMADRDYYLIAHGDFGNAAFTDHGKDVMLDRYILPQLSADNYYEAFIAYLNKADEFLGLARDGKPFDIGSDSDQSWRIFVTILAPLGISLVICLFWNSKMKTARKAADANAYIGDAGLVLTAQEDRFLYRTHTRTAIQQSSGGSGGTTINSAGFSGRGGKF